MKERHLASVHLHIKFLIIWDSHTGMNPSSSGSRRRTKRLTGKEPLRGGSGYIMKMAFARLTTMYFLTPNVTLNKIFILCAAFHCNLITSIEVILWNSIDLKGVCVCFISRIHGKTFHNISSCQCRMAKYPKTLSSFVSAKCHHLYGLAVCHDVY